MQAKSYPELNMAALYKDKSREIKHKVRELRLWYLLRTLDKKGGGHIHKDFAQESLVPTVLSYRQFRMALRRGEGVFWEIIPCKAGGQLIKLYSLLNVCRNLEVEKLCKTPVIVSVTSNLPEFKAVLFGTFHTAEKANPICRQTLRNLSSLSSSTQTRYDKRMGTDVIKNRVVTGLVIGRSVPSDMKSEGYYPELVNGSLVLCKRLPNSYYCSAFEQAPRGCIRDVNAALEADRNGLELNQDRTKRYFRTPQELIRCKLKKYEPSVLFRKEAANGKLHTWEFSYS